MEVLNKCKELLDTLSKDSKHPFVKHSALILSEDNHVLVAAWNKIPSELTELESRYLYPYCDDYVEQAEIICICRAAKEGISLEGKTMYINHFPYPESSRAIVMSGIKKVYCKLSDLSNVKFHHSETILKEAKVEIIHF